MPDEILDLSPAHRRVMETVWQRGPIARYEIAQLTGLTAATITRLTRDLEELGLVEDRIDRTGGRGQPARPVFLQPSGAYAVGVNFSHTYIDVGIVNLAGALIAHERSPLDRATPDAIADVARKGFDRLREARRLPLSRFLGAGFSVPGDFRPGGGLNAHAYFPHLAGLDLGPLFQHAMPLPVTIENDAASAAVGERVHGAGARHDTFMLIHIGHGVGSGLILNGRLYRGAHDNAGIVGVAFPLDQPRPSGQDLFAVLAEADISANDFDALVGVDLDHPAIDRWLTRAGDQLAEGLHVAVRTIDPAAVIIGGRLPPALLERLHARTPLLKVLAQDPKLPLPQFQISSLGPYAGVVGAASVCFFRAFFSPL